ncbi:MAG: hypothetical protein A2806_02520 [Candidatus Terrybacteria bacterium RIFCSPHIGHO2_01_FULL_48_17]|uniref:Dockerin domain-containing protein n=1 Tax=Candidatus Terrybacteria bacterium RIFCSPHIGHO2_01_FULL_48_17 TaxID=1802362 RepID=A0A1G2PJE1_9BACT|nr:MAG: hypothetical protein A2806_02520 [Candidatus Terrybacteria bacterium RIFCSPHIGHO2_01_FULL_48_17]
MRFFHCAVFILFFSVLFAGWFFFVNASHTPETQPQTRNVGISIEVPCVGEGCAAEQVPEPGPGPRDTRSALVVEGFASPGALLFITLNDAVAKTAAVSLSGIFSESITGLSPGSAKVGLFAVDSGGFTTPTVSVDIVLFEAQTTRVFDVLLPPTITVNNKEENQLTGIVEEVAIRQGERILVSGQTFPRAIVRATRFPDRQTQEVLADGRGRWEAIFATDKLIGSYTVSARSQLLSGLLSEPTKTVAFVVIPLPGREPSPPREPGIPPPLRPGGPVPEYIDLNGDRLVDIRDFSILLYNWGTPKDPRADLNSDGVVNLIDVSIMLYWWTG